MRKLVFNLFVLSFFSSFFYFQYLQVQVCSIFNSLNHYFFGKLFLFKFEKIMNWTVRKIILNCNFENPTIQHQANFHKFLVASLFHSFANYQNNYSFSQNYDLFMLKLIYWIYSRNTQKWKEYSSNYANYQLLFKNQTNFRKLSRCSCQVLFGINSNWRMIYNMNWSLFEWKDKKNFASFMKRKSSCDSEISGESNKINNIKRLMNFW
jgi:hypothetical protein